MNNAVHIYNNRPFSVAPRKGGHVGCGYTIPVQSTTWPTTPRKEMDTHTVHALVRVRDPVPIDRPEASQAMLRSKKISGT